MRKHLSGIFTALLAVTSVSAQNDPNLYDTWKMSAMNTTYSFWDRSGDDVDMGSMSFDLSTSGSFGSCKVRVSIPFDWRTEGKTVRIYFNLTGKSLITNATAKGQTPLDTVKKYCNQQAEQAYREYTNGFKVNPVFAYAISGNSINLGGTVLTSSSGKQRVPWPPQQETKTTTLAGEMSKLNNALAAANTETATAEKSVTTKSETVSAEKKIDVHSYVWDDGTRYEGEWLNGLRHGQGTVTFTDGSKYAGQWKADQMDGKGTFSWPSGSSYTGDFRNDMMQGNGTLTIPGGDKYTGEWVNNKKNGQGTFKWADGSSYTGQWKDNKMHGKGTYISASGTKQTGEFADDVFVK